MMFNKSFFSITPKTFNTVNIDLTRGESLFMVYFQVPISTKYQRIIAFEFICVNKGTFSTIPISFKDAKDKDLIEYTSSPFTFASTPQIGLIKLNLSLRSSLLSLLLARMNILIVLTALSTVGSCWEIFLEESPNSKSLMIQSHFLQQILTLLIHL